MVDCALLQLESDAAAMPIQRNTNALALQDNLDTLFISNDLFFRIRSRLYRDSAAAHHTSSRPSSPGIACTVDDALLPRRPTDDGNMPKAELSQTRGQSFRPVNLNGDTV